MSLVYNDKGQVTIFYTLMIGITVLVLALALAPGLKEQIETSRAVSSTAKNITTIGLDCGETNGSISVFDKAACVVSDVSLFGFIAVLIFLVGSIIGARIVYGE